MFETEITIMKNDYVSPWLAQIVELESYITEWINDEAPLDLEFLEAVKYNIVNAAIRYHDYANILLKEIEEVAKTEEVFLYLDNGNYYLFKNILTKDKFEASIVGSNDEDIMMFSAYQIASIL